jgi:simple sugar transport system substrate-binding protein
MSNIHNIQYSIDKGGRYDMKALKIFLGSLLIIGLVGASVLQFSSGEALAQEKKYKIAVVVHGGEADPFWKPVQRGVKDASELYPDVEVTYTGTTVFSVEEFMNNLETAIASKPDALVCTLAVPEAMDETLRKVIDAGLPVVAINAPDLREPVSERIPVLTYIGEDSYFIGVTAAKETLKRVTPKRAVFCSHHRDAANIDARGRGWVDTMTEQGITAESAPVAEPVNAEQAAEDVAAYLKDHPDTDVLFISNTAITEAVIKRLVADGVDVGNSIKIAQMDISAAILEYVQDGMIMFAMDQQPYLQGYMGVVFAYLSVKYGFTPPPAPLSTGPAVVTAADINPAKGY